MFGYIVTYLGGIITGVSLLYANKRSVQTALNTQQRRHDQEIRRLSTDNYALRQELDTVTRNRDCADAYRRGRHDGRNEPVADAERFAQNFDGHRGTVEFRNTTRAQQTTK